MVNTKNQKTLRNGPSSAKPTGHLSIYNYYLAYRCIPPAGYRNINSRRNLNGKPAHPTTAPKYQSLVHAIDKLAPLKSVPHHLSVVSTSPDTPQTLHFLIPKLTSTEGDQLCAWIAHFREVSNLQHWSDATGLASLRATIDSTLWESIKSKQTLDAALDALAASAYPAFKRFVFGKELNALHQDQFTFIAEYAHELDAILRRWQNAWMASEQETARKREDAFMRGLNLLTSLEILRTKFTTIPEILKYIQTIEDMLLHFAPAPTSQKHEEPTESLPQRPMRKNASPKWCSFHRSPHHSDSECRRGMPGRKDKQAN